MFDNFLRERRPRWTACTFVAALCICASKSASAAREVSRFGCTSGGVDGLDSASPPSPPTSGTPPSPPGVSMPRPSSPRLPPVGELRIG
eukprot:scaffold61802_cov61-Phaeocystis_antarctica.AAC.2